MIGKIKEKLKSENGAVQIIEATFVFPIMFIILFFLIYMGNAFFVKAQIQSVVAKNAVIGASYCADPMLQTIKEDGSIPALKEVNLDPYRYFGDMEGVENEISGKVKEKIENSSISFFKNMDPVVKPSKDKIAQYHNYILYSSFSVGVECKVKFPIKFLGQDSPYILNIKSFSEVAVDDTGEFIRNTDMVIDYFEDSKLGKGIKSVFEKINGVITNFK